MSTKRDLYIEMSTHLNQLSDILSNFRELEHHILDLDERAALGNQMKEVANKANAISTLLYAFGGIEKRK